MPLVYFIRAPLAERFVQQRFLERDGQEYPIICIEDGVKKPIAAKRGLPDDSGKALVSENRVYVRSLNSNNTVSTTEATWKDWEGLTETCFNNREADIGRFVRRHLSRFLSTNPEDLPEILKALAPKNVDDTEKAQRFLSESGERFDRLVKERLLSLPEHGSLEVAFVISGEVPEHSANQNFLNLVASNNLSYAGWPFFWIVSEQDSRPHVFEGAWEALIVSLQGAWPQRIDFWRIDPKGRFYHRRALQDDISTNPQAPLPMTALDFGIVTCRVGEAIAAGLALTRAMGCQPEECALAFYFRWNRLQNRILSSWTDPSRSIWGKAYQDEVTVCISVPLDTPPSALSDWVNRVTSPLFEIFDGQDVGLSVTDGIIRKMLSRQ